MKGRTFKLCVLTRWDFNFCVRSSPLRGRRKGQQAENDKTERVTGLGRKTREEIAKWNQMTAPRFQTGGRGGGGDIRHPRPPFGAEKAKQYRRRSGRHACAVCHHLYLHPTVRPHKILQRGEPYHRPGQYQWINTFSVSYFVTVNHKGLYQGSGRL